MKNLNFTESNKLFDFYLKNLENIMETPACLFLDRIGGLKEIINSGKLSEEENNRLRLLEAYLSFLYYDNHFYDMDYYDKDQYLLPILDNVESNIDNISEHNLEGFFLFWMSRLYSVIRFDDSEEELNIIWDKLKEIDLTRGKNLEFDTLFMNEKAKEVYDRCKSHLTYGEREKEIYNVVKALIMESLGKENHEVVPDMFLREDYYDIIDYNLENKIRDEFDISIPNYSQEEIKLLGNTLEDRIDTLGDLVRYINSYSEF